MMMRRMISDDDYCFIDRTVFNMLYGFAYCCIVVSTVQYRNDLLRSSDSESFVAAVS